MEDNKRVWLNMIMSLTDKKNKGYLTNEEYSLFKEKLNSKQAELLSKERKRTDYSSYANSLSKNQIIELIELSFEDETGFSKKLNNLKRIDLYHLISLYNWDDGLVLPALILKHKECDFALAMQIFDLADGCAFIEECFFNKRQPSKYNKEWWDFCLKLFNDMGNGKFKLDDTPNELSVGLKIVLIKNGIVNNLTKDMKFLFE